MRIIFPALILILNFSILFAQGWIPEVRENVPLDSIRLSDPAILADEKTQTYYMTGTGGLALGKQGFAEVDGSIQGYRNRS